MDRETILALLRERIQAFAASRIERSAAEDLTQETMLVLHEKYGHLEQAGDLLPVAFRIVRFKLAGYLRKRNRRGEDRTAEAGAAGLADPAPGPEEAALKAEMRAAFLRAFASLGERCRELLRLKLAGRSFEQIREHFGAASINTVYTWDLRCRNQLKQALHPMGGDQA